MTPIETLASLWIAEHPEYDTELADEQVALAADYQVEGGRANPFLHLSMHLTISEQCSIDQPRGIRAAVEAYWPPSSTRCTRRTTRRWSASAR